MQPLVGVPCARAPHVCFSPFKPILTMSLCATFYVYLNLPSRQLIFSNDSECANTDFKTAGSPEKKMLEGAGIKPGSLGQELTQLTTGPISQPTDQQVERVPKVARVQQRPEK